MSIQIGRQRGNAMNLQSSKKTIFSFLKDKNFLSTANKRIFVQDCGFYLIVVEIVPLRKEGFFLNVGVKFLWTAYFDISYDYSNSDIRINVPNNPLGAVLFDSPSVDYEIEYIMREAQDRIVEYQGMKDFNTFRLKIENRNDFAKKANPNLKKVDVSLAITKMFSGETLNSLEILHEAAQNNEVAQELLLHCDDLALFHDGLINIINSCRSVMSTKFKLILNPISVLWSY